MEQKKSAPYFLFLCLAASFVLVFFIVKPFLGPLILAAVFAFLFQPIFHRVLRVLKGKENIAALVTTFIALAIVLVPVGFLGGQLFYESSQLYKTVASVNEGVGFVTFIEKTIQSLQSQIPVLGGVEIDITVYFKKLLLVVEENVGAIFSSFGKIVLQTVVFLMAFYFLLKDGSALKNYLVVLSPLQDHDDELIVKRLKMAVLATVKGSLAIGLVQGALSGIGFAIFGVPNPVLWGSVAAISALIPGIGTALVLAPAIGFLFVTGNVFGGIGLLIWGIVAVGMVDNLLAPRLIGRGMKMHPLSVFLTVLGGLAFFGPLGFLLGPLTLSVCVALIDIYFSFKTTDGLVRT